MSTRNPSFFVGSDAPGLAFFVFAVRSNTSRGFSKINLADIKSLLLTTGTYHKHQAKVLWLMFIVIVSFRLAITRINVRYVNEYEIRQRQP